MADGLPPNRGGDVARRALGLPPADAEKRVNETFENAKNTEIKVREAADAARKAAAKVSLWMFLALLIGDFNASLMATFGGRLRDDAAVTSPRALP